MVDEGVVKFHCDWTRAGPLDEELVAPLNAWRRRLYELQLVGYDAEHQVGYGNLSVRDPRDPSRLIITGTQTGHIGELTGAHYTVVTHADLASNSVRCTGPVSASSETLTHFEIYALDERINPVIHVHDDSAWTQLKDRLPTTAPDVPYGTVAMADELARLFALISRPTGEHVVVMGGHRGGLLAFASDLDAAGAALLQAVQA